MSIHKMRNELIEILQPDKNKKINMKVAKSGFFVKLVA